MCYNALMVKRKSKLKEIPRPYLVTGIVSLGLNALVFVVLIIGCAIEQSGIFNYAIVNEGTTKMCSQEFRRTVEKSSDERGDTANDKGLMLALVDYPCTNNGAKSFYEKGYQDYVRSLGLDPQN